MLTIPISSPTAPLSGAGSTTPTAVRSDGCVFFIEGMTLVAVSHRCTKSRGTKRTLSPIVERRDNREVRDFDTSSMETGGATRASPFEPCLVVAEVVNRHPVWNRADELCVDPSMNQPFRSSDTDAAVSVAPNLARGKEQASVCGSVRSCEDPIDSLCSSHNPDSSTGGVL